MLMGSLLAFGFVTPALAAAGAGLVAVPILIHILNRRRFKVVPWAAMDFLLKAMRKNRRRLRFEQLLLLATRCLLIFLAGAALARPLFRADNTLASLAGRRAALHIFVIDNSFSMAYQADRPGAKTHLDQAKLIAKALINRMTSGEESVAIVTTARSAQAVISTPVYDLRAAQAAIDRITQSFTAADQAAALSLARDIASSQNRQPDKYLYLIDDSTRVAWESNPDGIHQAAADFPRLFKSGVTHFNLAKPGQFNQAVVDLKPTQSLVTNWFPVDLVADVRGFGPSATDSQLNMKIDGDVLPGGSIPTKASADANPIPIAAPSLAGGIHVLTASLSADDRLPADDMRYRVIQSVSQLKVLIVEGERGTSGLGSSGAFLDLALNPAPSGSDSSDSGSKFTSYVATERISDLELAGKILTDYRCICLCGVGQIQDAQAEQLEKFVEQGGTLMLFMGDPITAENYNATLLKRHLLPGPLTKRITVGPEDPPRRFAFNPNGTLHPILSDFYKQQNTGMESAEIYSYWQIDLPPDSKAERVLDFLPVDKNQPADPAITVHSFGSGRVVFYATSADPNSEWTTFMAHQAYPALMHMLLLGTATSGDQWLNLNVGQPLSIPSYVQVTADPVLKDSDSIQYPLEQTTDSTNRSVLRSAPLIKPGIYSLTTGDANYKIAVNIPSEASDIRAVDDAAIKKSLGDIDLRFEADEVPAEPLQANQGKDVGWAVMTVVLLLLASESFMAMRFGHHRKTG